MITDNLPNWIGLLITLCTGIFFWGIFYNSSKKTQETSERTQLAVEKISDNMAEMKTTLAVINQRQEYIQENMSALKDRVKGLENNKVA